MRRTAFAVALTVFGAVLWLRMGAYAGGADSSGYLNSARLLSRGRATSSARTLSGIPDGRFRPDAYVPLGFRPAGPGSIAPIYPVGFPLLLAAASRVVGWRIAPPATMLLHALIAVCLTFWLARECGLSWNAGAAAALLLATSPLFLFMSLQLMSDTPALVWTTAAVLFAWRSRGGRSGGLRKPDATGIEAGVGASVAWAASAGVALSIAVLVRPTNIIAIAPVAVCLGRSPRRWLALIVAGLPGAILLGIYNEAAYGHAVATGYQGLESDFSMAFALPTLRHYAVWLPVLATPVAVLALGLPRLWRQHEGLAAVLLTWIVAYLAVYSFYTFTRQTWWFLRYVLPVFPAFIVGGLWVGREWVERWSARVDSRARSRARAANAAFVAVALAHSLGWTAKLDALDIGRGERVYPDVSTWANRNLPGNAAIVAMQVSGALFCYTRFPIVRWDDFDGDSLRRFENDATAGGHALYAVLFPFEREALLPFLTSSPHPGRWMEVGTVRDVTIWRLTPSSDR